MEGFGQLLPRFPMRVCYFNVELRVITGIFLFEKVENTKIRDMQSFPRRQHLNTSGKLFWRSVLHPVHCLRPLETQIQRRSLPGVLECKLKKTATRRS